MYLEFPSSQFILSNVIENAVRNGTRDNMGHARTYKLFYQNNISYIYAYSTCNAIFVNLYPINLNAIKPALVILKDVNKYANKTYYLMMRISLF